MVMNFFLFFASRLRLEELTKLVGLSIVGWFSSIGAPEPKAYFVFLLFFVYHRLNPFDVSTPIQSIET